MASNPITIAGDDASDRPFDMVVPVTKADAPLPDGTCRGLVVGAAGTINFRDGSGAIRTNFPVFQGTNPVVCQEVREGGTASDIWAGY